MSSKSSFSFCSLKPKFLSKSLIAWSFWFDCFCILWNIWFNLAAPYYAGFPSFWFESSLSKSLRSRSASASAKILSPYTVPTCEMFLNNYALIFVISSLYLKPASNISSLFTTSMNGTACLTRSLRLRNYWIFNILLMDTDGIIVEIYFC